MAAAAGREIAVARRAAGASQRLAAARAGVSMSQFGRLERGELRRPSLEAICRASRAVGLAFAARLYPDGTRLRDKGQLALEGRFAAAIGNGLRVAREIGLPMPGDQRAWDLRVTDGHANASVEAEVRLFDVQATQRRIGLKQRDDPDAGVVILLLADTAHNRRVLSEHREALRPQFPLDGGAILQALRAGRLPAASGILRL